MDDVELAQDGGVRDLDRLQEDDGNTRPIALIALLVLLTTGLVLGLGLVVAQSGAENGADAADPLAQLEQGTWPERTASPSASSSADDLPDVHREELTFPETLAERETPELVAALAAAEAELAHPDPLEGMAPAPDDTEAAIRTSLPAGYTATQSPQQIARTARRDPMVRDAVANAGPRTMAPEGREGAFTVQVISYESETSAQAFAEGLRSRGHRAFVVSADLEERGRFYRVRIGPFGTERQARAYRRRFEREERMNTIVVRRRTPSESTLRASL